MMRSIDWSPAHGVAFYLALGIALGLILLLARQLARSPTARSWPLLILRAAVLATLVTLLLNPVRLSENRLPPRLPEMVFLVDWWRRMALAHPSSRLDQVKDVLAKTRRLLSAGDQTRISLYRFGQELVAAASAADLHPDDEATRLFESLERLPSRFEGAPNGIVIFSDGRTTDTGDFAELAAAYQRLKVPLHVFPVGDPNASGDVAIQDLIAPRDAPPGSRVPVHVVLRSHGFAGQRTEVQIRSLTDPRRQPLATFPLTLQEGIQACDLVLTQDRSAGQLVAEVLPLAGEATQENNRVPFQITSRQDKIRVIYMEGTVSPPEEYRFIQDALQEDPNIECVSMLVNEQLAAQPVLYRVHDPSRGFPTTRAELFTYDVVICSDIARGAFTQQQLDWTAELVAQRGGGFVMIGGFTSFGSGKWNQTVWDGLVPVEMTGGEGYYHNQTFRVRIPRQADRHPIWRIVDDPVKNRQILDQMPPFHGTNQADRLKPAATLLGTSDRGFSGTGVMPIFSCEPFGRGRTFAMLTDSTVGWGADFERYWGEGDNRYFRKFWRNVIYWLVENSAKGNRRLRVDTDKIIYHPGQPIKITAQAYDDQLEASNRYKLTARLRPAANRANAQRAAARPVLQETGLSSKGAERPYHGELATPPLRNVPASGNDNAPMRLAALEVVASEGNRTVAQATLDVQIL